METFTAVQHKTILLESITVPEHATVCCHLNAIVVALQMSTRALPHCTSAYSDIAAKICLLCISEGTRLKFPRREVDSV